MYSFGGKYAETYTSTCEKCGAKIEVSGTKRHNAEFDVLIFVRCHACGHDVGMYVSA